MTEEDMIGQEEDTFEEEVRRDTSRGEGDEHTVFVGNKPFMKLS
ncbi:MAG TPA: hypothetical protein VJJ21_01555 [Candidatus Nanoarchaeia archaeon]|nr:hypothetical protein [Candidatus Nanoarchaeia archaeon]